MKNRRIFPMLFFALLVSAISGFALAADLTFDPTLPGRWEAESAYRYEKDYTLTKEEAAGCRSKLDRMLNILKETPPFASPKGFLARTHLDYEPPCDWYQQFLPPYKTQRVRMMLSVSLPGLFRVKGKAVPQDEPPYFKVDFNNLMPFARPSSLNYEGVWDEQGRFIITEPHVMEEGQGYTIYEGHSIILTRGSKPLWVPVTQEQYLKAMIKFYRLKKKQNPDDVSNDMMTEYLNEELNKMSPAERKSPGYYFAGGENPSGLTPKDDTNGSRLMALNPDYFDPNMPRTAVQLIVIRLYYSAQYPREAMDFQEAGTNLTMHELEQNLNYKDVAGLLDK